LHESGNFAEPFGGDGSTGVLLPPTVSLTTLYDSIVCVLQPVPEAVEQAIPTQPFVNAAVCGKQVPGTGGVVVFTQSIW
jgi:hypothetical protein